ncbi:MAG: DUF3238 domain-containing protein [Actinobacteria bacterium]|nr:DUF3238 domain-containing protein [Actinomycetota bacterium]
MRARALIAALLAAITLLPLATAAQADAGFDRLMALKMSGKVVLSWGTSFPYSGPYEVFRDGELIGRANASPFVDASAESAYAQRYAVTAASTFDSSDLETMTATPRTLSQARMIADPGNDSVPTTSDLSYTTFIPESRVLASGCVLSSTAYFEGDSRGFDSNATTYRTRVRAHVDWRTGRASFSASTRDSVLWDVITEPVTGFSFPYSERKNAGTEGITTSQIYGSSQQVIFTVIHQEANPFCLVKAPISYNVTVSMWITGEVTLYGLYKPVPNHEVYVRAGAWPYTTIFRQTGLSFVCLYVNTGTCTDRSY